MATIREFPESPDESNERFTATPERIEGVTSRTPRAERQPRYGQPFFPAVPFGMSLFVLATALALGYLAISNPAPLQHPADPLNHEKVNPRPEWYFLFLFQILKVFQGPWELVGTAIIPGILTVLLLGLPFYDRNWSRRAVRRPVAVTCGILAILGLAYLTYLPIASTAALQSGSGDLLTTVAVQPKWVNIQAIFTKNCQPCHIGGTKSGGLGLDTYAATMAGGSIAAGGVVNGAVIKPGNPKGSYLYQAITGTQKVGARMPANGQTLPGTDVQNIYNWIQNGAKNP